MAPSKPPRILTLKVSRHNSQKLTPKLAAEVKQQAKEDALRVDVTQPSSKLAQAIESASEWNSLLMTARAERGPQWDIGTQQFLVDKYSDLYYDPTELLEAVKKVTEEELGPDPATQSQSQSHPERNPSSYSQYQHSQAPSQHRDMPPPYSVHPPHHPQSMHSQSNARHHTPQRGRDGDREREYAMANAAAHMGAGREASPHSRHPDPRQHPGAYGGGGGGGFAGSPSVRVPPGGAGPYAGGGGPQGGGGGQYNSGGGGSFGDMGSPMRGNMGGMPNMGAIRPGIGGVAGMGGGMGMGGGGGMSGGMGAGMGPGGMVGGGMAAGMGGGMAAMAGGMGGMGGGIGGMAGGNMGAGGMSGGMGGGMSGGMSGGMGGGMPGGMRPGMGGGNMPGGMGGSGMGGGMGGGNMGVGGMGGGSMGGGGLGGMPGSGMGGMVGGMGGMGGGINPMVAGGMGSMNMGAMNTIGLESATMGGMPMNMSPRIPDDSFMR